MCEYVTPVITMETTSTTTIANHAWSCALRFNALVSQAGGVGLVFEDQLARFNIWSANIGVFAEAHASLDYRVRSSIKVKTMMIRLLQSLQRKLQFGEHFTEHHWRSLLTGQALNNIDNHKTESNRNSSGATDSKFEENLSQSEENGSSTTSSNSSHSSVSESSLTPVAKSLKDVEAAINRLHRLAMSIRKSSTHSQNPKATKLAIIDEDGNDTSAQFAEFTQRMVQSRFPAANPILHERLANLIFKRRKVFSYQQRHQQKLAQVVYPHPQFQQQLKPYSATQPVQSHPSQRVDSSSPKTLLQDLAVNRALSTTTASALTARSIPSRPAPSIVSSSAPSSSNEANNVTFPSPPTVLPNAREFQCQYCGILLDIKELKPRRWR